MPKPFYLYVLNFPNGKKYIGLTNNPARRLKDHHRAARRDRHAINRAFLKYGMPALRVLCIGDRSYIRAPEVQSIEAFQTRNRRFGYNSSLGGDLSRCWCQITAKGGAAKQGRTISAKTARAISATLTGHAVSAETRETRGQIRRATEQLEGKNVHLKQSPKCVSR
jgi:hypothetical protein